MAVKLNVERLDGSIGLLQKVFNQDVLESFTKLAMILKAERENNGGNAVIEQAYQACVKTQNIYNPCVDSYKGFFKDLSEVGEIATYLESQANIGDVRSASAEFNNQKISAEDVRL